MGDYELLRRLGAGGMAEVWLGRRAGLAGASKAVAIKLLARQFAAEPVYRQMFLTESRVSMLLSHSNVVQVFDAGEIDGECFMVMEWVDGLDLAELTRKLAASHTPLPVGVVAHLVAELLRGLAYTHNLDHEGHHATVVHRDVSPHNVLVSVSGEVKLADFGVARLVGEDSSGLHVKGKLRYMAPEQLRGDSRAPTVDLYAVGAILHELLTGAPLRPWRDQSELLRRIALGERPALTVDAPIELVRLHARLLHPDPRGRIGSAEQALELLLRWPGARPAAVELARLVRGCVGVETPRSGAQDQSPTSSSAAATLVLAKPEPIGGDPTRTYLDPASTTQPSVRIREAPPEPARPRGARGLVPLGIALAAIGVGVSLGWLLARPEAPEVAAREVDALESTASAPIPVASRSQVAIVSSAAPDPVAAPTAPEHRGAPATTVGPRLVAKDTPPSTVEFVLGPGVSFLYVKVDGHELALEPTATIELPPGRHAVFVRASPEDGWLRVDRISVGRGRGYKVATAPDRLSVGQTTPAD